jgi:hypothetical protein
VAFLHAYGKVYRNLNVGSLLNSYYNQESIIIIEDSGGKTTCQQTLWSSIFLEKLVKKFPACYGTQRFVMFTESCNCTIA